MPFKGLEGSIHGTYLVWACTMQVCNKTLSSVNCGQTLLQTVSRLLRKNSKALEALQHFMLVVDFYMRSQGKTSLTWDKPECA